MRILIFYTGTGGPPVAEKIRQILLDPENDMGARCEALLYAAARAEHVEKTLKPALEAGKLVLCERFVLSSLAYQGFGRGLGEDAIARINAFATDNLEPDLTLFFHIPPEESLARKEGALDRLEREQSAFHKNVALGYEILLKKGYGEVIDASLDRDTVYRTARDKILSYWRRKNK